MVPELISTLCELIVEIAHATIHHARSLWTLYSEFVQLKWVIPMSLLHPWEWMLGKGSDTMLELSRPQVFTILLGT
jgi:hypothetical protein